MGHCDNADFVKRRRSQGHFVVSLVFTFSLLVVEIQTTQQLSNGLTAGDASNSPHGFSKVRRISPRVLHKRSIPIDNTLKPSEKGNHLDDISIELPLDSSKVWLDLRLNWDLMSDGYFERFQNNGTDVIVKPDATSADLCHYQGKIRGKPTSWAALSVCNGIRGVVFDGEHLHHLEPSETINNNNAPANSELSQWETLHYKHADLKHNSTCDHNESHSKLPAVLQQISHNLVDSEKVLASSNEDVLRPKSIQAKLGKVKRGVKTEDGYREPYDANAKSRYVELVMVVDNKKFKELGGDLKETIRRTKDISNIVNALYAPLNIFIALIGVIVWTEADAIKISSNGDDTLANFLHYRKERLNKDHPNDNAQLLTAVEFENGVVGKAMQGPMCSYKLSGGVNSDYKALTGIVATTIAHELGHNIGLSHDAEECKCPGPGGRCIMSASTSANRTSFWSSCSLEGFAFAFEHGMDYCLRNKPKRLFDGPVCGNGFTEPGEECDCGLPDFCKNTCCNAETCTLHKNASCGAGTCCDLSTCHVKAGGTECRPASNTCDLPEYCTGESEYCPEDVHKLNGLECDPLAYCYDGKCRTHTDQCKLLWGPSGNNSDNLCYQKNVNGSRFGNCGYNLITETFKQCKPEDNKCGLLHCKYYHEKLEFGYEPVATLSSFFVNSQGNIHPCRSVTVDFGTQDVDPGLVPDGAKCGDKKMCVSQKCIPVEAVMEPFTCPDGCGSHGVCNSKGNCHCDIGYGGYNCRDSGFGGSIDSGPAIDPYATSIFAKSLYVTFLGFIPLIAIISFYIYYANDNLKKLCKRGQLVARPHHRNNNKPQGNGSVSLRTVDISNPTPNSTSTSNNNSKTTPDDFFGQYKGFSLAPLKQGQEQNGTHNVAVKVNETKKHKNVNNNTSPSERRAAPSNVRPISTSAGSNGSIPSATNSNVYYSPVPTQTINENLVKNHNNTTVLTNNKNFSESDNLRHVSWAQPIAQPLPTNSPGSEDETGIVGSGTPLYSNTSNQHKPPRPLSPPNPLNQHQRFEDSMSSHDAANSQQNLQNSTALGSSAGNVHTERSRIFEATNSALSRLAGLGPFVRNSIRNFTSGSSGDHHKASSLSSAKSNINRKTLEISTPILLPTDTKQSANMQNLISIAPKDDDVKTEDTVDYANMTTNTKKTSKGRYANVPLIDESPVKTANPPPPPENKQWHKNIQLERIKPESKQTERKAVLRAHSMIQANRNSIHNTNPNYNSLRRTRPAVPPPKPPESPPPPPHNSSAVPVSATTTTTTTTAAIPRAKSESPPPICKTKNTLRPTVNTSNISSILKFSLGRNNTPKSDNNSSSTIVSTTPKGPAPIAKMDIDPQSPTSPQQPNPSATDNIYDEIGECMEESAKVEEKIETLSTGSSESAGGLLSEIIFEIQNRNKDSIYNSVDRRKKKRENLANANAQDKDSRKTDVTVEQQQPQQQKSFSPILKSSPKFRHKPITGKPVTSENSSPRSSFLSGGVPQKPVTVSSKTTTTTTSTPAVAPTTVFSTLSNPTPPAPKVPQQQPTSAPKPIIPPPPIVFPSTGATALSTSPPTVSTAKPTCAVNGIPKISNSTSYVAKINYFSNLGAYKSDSPMKPLNSLNSTLGDSSKSGLSSIYAPSNVNPEPTHLSTIRHTWSRSYAANKLPTESTDENNAPLKTAGIYSPNSSSDYGTIGRNKGKKIEKVEDKIIKPPAPQQPQPQQQQGYKPFNPYLNRPLTFSTFRPASSPSATTATSSTSSSTGVSTSSSSTFNRLPGAIGVNTGASPITSTKASLTLSNSKPVSVSVCSVTKPPSYGLDRIKGASDVGGVPLSMRSPTKVVQ